MMMTADNLGILKLIVMMMGVGKLQKLDFHYICILVRRGDSSHIADAAGRV